MVGLLRPISWFTLAWRSSVSIESRLDSEAYGQRWMAETAFSAIKRRYGSAVRPRAWYREFRELVLTAAVYNLEQAIKD
ncbi:hypothetical protein SAMN05216388_105417 [Halorientalis persicus]|uniref:Transposase IS4-like domain-containing protein n=1 Tax=Halorientalis persicus TaxID=1367881 RepID=A0A1H8WC73_9EURY|nr:hypothetical protein SAMN05216388_105417 [Halorientalis persicus]